MDGIIQAEIRKIQSEVVRHARGLTGLVGSLTRESKETKANLLKYAEDLLNGAVERIGKIEMAKDMEEALQKEIKDVVARKPSYAAASEANKVPIPKGCKTKQFSGSKLSTKIVIEPINKDDLNIETKKIINKTNKNKR